MKSSGTSTVSASVYSLECPLHMMVEMYGKEMNQRKKVKGVGKGLMMKCQGSETV
jgi:hypothetical protein